jgi:carboxypeptidase Taq
MKDIAKYNLFVEKYREFTHLSSINEILGWDQQVLMPKGAAGLRQSQSEALAKQVHRLSTAPEYGSLLTELYEEGEDSFSPVQWKNIKEAMRAYKESVQLPESIILEIARLTMEGYAVWEGAKASGKYQDFAGIITRWINLKKRIAGILYPEKDAYDVCLDSFERGASREKIDRVFGVLKTGIIGLLREIKNSKVRLPLLPTGDYSLDAQKKLCRYVADKLGFSFERGRLDESVHPFTGGYMRYDVRMTTYYRNDSFFKGLSGLVHESGHAIYEQGLPDGDAEFMPAGAPLGMAIHESQSILYERMVGQAPVFFQWLLPKAAEYFGDLLSDCDADSFYRSIHEVKPSLIRIEADEVTYPLHIILRYELEKKLFDGSLSVNDLPAAWNEMSRELLGVMPDNDSCGVLQDVHWSDGSFGYFPCYTLGAVYAAQLFAAICKARPDTLEKIAIGEFEGIRKWLNSNIHSYGSLYEADELIKMATGNDLSAEFFLDYLRKKYALIYDF